MPATSTARPPTAWLPSPPSSLRSRSRPRRRRRRRPPSPSACWLRRPACVAPCAPFRPLTPVPWPASDRWRSPVAGAVALVGALDDAAGSPPVGVADGRCRRAVGRVAGGGRPPSVLGHAAASPRGRGGSLGMGPVARRAADRSGIGPPSCVSPAGSASAAVRQPARPRGHVDTGQLEDHRDDVGLLGPASRACRRGPGRWWPARRGPCARGRRGRSNQRSQVRSHFVVGQRRGCCGGGAGRHTR